MADIFISYSKQEPDLTIALARDLERRGFSTWWDTGLLPGEEFQERILAELDKAKVVIVIWTAHSVVSRWVQAEAQWAADKNKLITLRSPDLDPARIPLPFNTKHTDFVTDREKIFGALERHNISPRFGHAGMRNPAWRSLRSAASERALTWPWRARLADPFFRNPLNNGLRTLKGRLHFDRIHLALAIIVVTLAIATVQLIDVSRSLNHTLVLQLEPHPEGVELQGRFLYPNYLIVFSIFALAGALVSFSAVSAAYLKRRRHRISPELVNLKQDIDDIVRYVNNIIGYIYGADKDVPRFDIIDVSVRYDIRANGDTVVNATFEIHCIRDTAHFWKYWIDADAESDAVLSQRQLYFEAVDTATMQKLDWLPASNDPRHKVFAIFFPEVKPGERKTLRLSYFWPGYMKKLTDLGATSFEWTYRSQHPDKQARCRLEWVFSSEMPVIRCRITGRQSRTALLKFVEEQGSGVWVYEDHTSYMDGSKYSVEFSVADV